MHDSLFDIKRYQSEDKQAWDTFVRNSKNGIFLFERDYMDYHSDRFADCSYIIYRKKKIYALFPGNIVGDTLYSHQGLTYGGLLLNNKSLAEEVISMFELLNSTLKLFGINRVIYKPIPYVYHKIPSQEDLYALFRCTNAKLIGRNIGSVIYMENKLPFTESRKSGLRKSIREGVKVLESHDYYAFWNILEENLMNKYGAKPVHTVSELLLLSSRFPQNIKLYMAYKDERPIGGTVLYLNNNVVHTQYISATVEGKEVGALDFLFDFLINKEFNKYALFDFGTSNEDNGKILNESLIFQKEGFGGRGVISDMFEYTL